MSLKNAFATNKRAEKEGAWIDLCANADGTMARLKIARAGRRNKDYTKALEKHSRPFRMIINELSPEADDKIMANVLAESIILDWEHVQEEDGVDVPFTKENALRILIAYPDLIDMVTRRAGELETFRNEQLEDDAKN